MSSLVFSISFFGAGPFSSRRNSPPPPSVAPSALTIPALCLRPPPPPLLPQQRLPSLNNPIVHDPEIVLPRIPMLVHEMHTPLLRRRAHLVAALDETGVNFFAAVVAQDRGDGIVVLGYVQREKVR